MKLTENQRNYLVKQIAEKINDGDFENGFYFQADSLNIIWSRNDEAYVVLKPDITYEYVGPEHLDSTIDELSDEALFEYLENNEGIETQEELDEYFEDLEVEA